MNPTKVQTADSFEALELRRNDSLPWVVLFHGYGASAYDLFPLAELLDKEGKYNWLFPQAPLQAHAQAGQIRSWFDLDVERLIDLNQKKDFDGFIYENPKSLEDCLTKLKLFFKELKLEASNSIIGGFSQGALLSTHYALSTSAPFKGLMIFSGTISCFKQWQELSGLAKFKKYFQSHGLYDDILHVEVAQKLHDELEKANLKGSFHLFEGGHEIPFNIQDKASLFLKELV